MKRVLLTLAVAAIGGLASAQTATTDVTTTQAVSNTISVDKTSVTLTLGTADTSVLSYSSNDGATHAITVGASAWAGGPTGGTVFPKLSANANELRSSANAAPTTAPTLVTAAANTSSTLNVSLLAENVSGAGLQAGTYTSTVTYTLN